jgi:hypothetical protein
VHNFRLHKVAGDLGRNGKEVAIAQGGHPFDFPVMVANEFQMGDVRGEILPAGKGFRLDHDAVQLALGFDGRIDVVRDLLKVVRFERSLGTNVQDPFDSI